MNDNIKYISEKLLFPVITAVLIAVITALVLSHLGVDKNGVPHTNNEEYNDSVTEIVEPKSNDASIEISEKSDPEMIQKTSTPTAGNIIEQVKYFEVKFIYPIDLANSTLLIDGTQPEIIKANSLGQSVRLREKSGNFEIELKSDKYRCKKVQLLRNNQVISFNLSNDCKSID